MNGEIIAGYRDPEIARIEAEIRKLGGEPGRKPMLASGPKAASLLQLQDVLEMRKRMADRRSSIGSLDELRARQEALELARAMKAQGYTDAQIVAVVRPMLVSVAETVTGRKRSKSERKAARKQVLKRLGEGFKKAVKGAFKGLAKLNPALVTARAYTLQLVANNAAGLATRMARMGPDRAKQRWQSIGGDWSKLRAAIEQGAAKPMRGFEQSIGVAPALISAGAELLSSAGKAEPKASGKKSMLATLGAIARPVLKIILPLFGIKLAEDGSVQVDGNKPEDDATRKALEQLGPDTDLSRAVEAQAKDAADPSTGAGEGHNSGSAALPGWAIPAIAIAAVLLLPKR
ncbi:MAG: hypothetical protein N2483_02700 [Burkholderiaceae bacterium]|nr:hypothetical protein [Burkholderiaceae bacterium]